MAKTVLKRANIVITVAGTAYNLSDHCSSLTLEDTTADVDVTSFGPSEYTERLAGMKTAQITADFFQDYAGTSVEECLRACYTASTAFKVECWPNGTTTSSTNAKYSLPEASSNTYTPIAGAVGDANAVAGVVFSNAGTSGLTRSTS